MSKLLEIQSEINQLLWRDRDEENDHAREDYIIDMAMSAIAEGDSNWQEIARLATNLRTDMNLKYQSNCWRWYA
jgi:hypothetical protein